VPANLCIRVVACQVEMPGHDRLFVVEPLQQELDRHPGRPDG